MDKKIIHYMVVTASNAIKLEGEVNQYTHEGWRPVGSHVVVETHRQNRFSGTQHMDTIIEREYSQTLIKEG